MKIINLNPYRILGVFANSPKKDIIANKSKAKAFIKVNKPVVFPLDLKGVLPELSRTLEGLNQAESSLSIAKDQIRYAQFWFIKSTQVDDIAFNHLFAGNIEESINIWGKQESMSSLQNILVCCLIKEKFGIALKMAEKLYEKYGACYISKVDANSTLQMTATDLLYQFIDSIGEEIGFEKLLGYGLESDTKEHIRSQTIVPLINFISSEVEKSKKVNRKDPIARLESGKNLASITKEPLRQLKNLLSTMDSQYQMIADKLGLELLQCGIDYFNNSEEDNAPQKAMWIQKYAQSVVVGTLAIQRCNENVGILQKIIDNLPPKEVIVEDKAIKAELSNFVKLPDKISHAIALLENTKPHLESIKRKLGQSNTYYLKLSTQIIGNALHNIIEEVNAVQQGNFMELDNGHTIDLDILMTPSDKLAKYNRIKSTVSEAWRATIIMDGFDMDSEFRTRYNVNRNTLMSMCNQMNISTYTGSPSQFSHTVSQSGESSSNLFAGNIGCILWVVASVVVGTIISSIANNSGGFVFGVLIVLGIYSIMQR